MGSRTCPQEITLDARELNLLGKDFFSEAEAAHYCCVSLSQFRERAAQHGIVSIWFMGKKLYRREDLQRAIERASRPSEIQQWPQSNGEGTVGNSRGRIPTGNGNAR